MQIYMSGGFWRIEIEEVLSACEEMWLQCDETWVSIVSMQRLEVEIGRAQHRLHFVNCCYYNIIDLAPNSEQDVERD